MLLLEPQQFNANDVTYAAVSSFVNILSEKKGFKKQSIPLLKYELMKSHVNICVFNVVQEISLFHHWFAFKNLVPVRLILRQSYIFIVKYSASQN